MRFKFSHKLLSSVLFFLSLYLFCNLNNVHRYGSVLGCGIEFFFNDHEIATNFGVFFFIFIFFRKKISVRIFQTIRWNYVRIDRIRIRQWTFFGVKYCSSKNRCLQLNCWYSTENPMCIWVEFDAVSNRLADCGVRVCACICIVLVGNVVDNLSEKWFFIVLMSEWLCDYATMKTF